MELYLMRHPAVAVAAGICYGQTDVPPCAGYEELVRQAAARLPDPTGLRVYSSPLRRCQVVARMLADDGSPVTDPDLLELHFGDWENRPWSEIPRAQIDAWADDFEHYPPPGGESVAAFLTRIRAFVARIRERDEDCLVVGHTGWIRFLLADLLEAPARAAFTLHIDFLGLSHVRLTPDTRKIMYINR